MVEPSCVQFDARVAKSPFITRFPLFDLLFLFRFMKLPVSTKAEFELWADEKLISWPVKAVLSDELLLYLIRVPLVTTVPKVRLSELAAPVIVCVVPTVSEVLVWSEPAVEFSTPTPIAPFTKRSPVVVAPPEIVSPPIAVPFPIVELAYAVNPPLNWVSVEVALPVSWNG